MTPTIVLEIKDIEDTWENHFLVCLIRGNQQLFVNPAEKSFFKNSSVRFLCLIEFLYSGTVCTDIPDGSWIYKIMYVSSASQNQT